MIWFLGVLEFTFLTCLSLAEAAVPGQYLVSTLLIPVVLVLDSLSLEVLVSLTFSTFLVDLDFLGLPGHAGARAK